MRIIYRDVLLRSRLIHGGGFIIENFLDKIAIMIPSLNPDESLIKYVSSLKEIGFNKIIIINDGSRVEFDSFFERLVKMDCDVVSHAVNEGKGRALKTGYHYYIQNYSNTYKGVVTADADGQHSPQDTYKVALNLYENLDSIILGTRDFNEKNVPFKSRFGNKVTTFVFKLLYGKKINDTQTGLRGFSNENIIKTLPLLGEKFEYEINVLIYAVRENINLKEVTIETIYVDGNRETHFDPISDSIKIYRVIFTSIGLFALSGIISFAVDILFFNIIISTFTNNLEVSKAILYSTIFARIISSIVNYNFNKNIVFKEESKDRIFIIKYYILWLFILISSWLLVTFFTQYLSLPPTFVKVFVDAFLFIISFQVQRLFIFRKKVNQHVCFNSNN